MSAPISDSQLIGTSLSDDIRSYAYMVVIRAYMVRMPTPEMYLCGVDAYTVKKPESGECAYTVNVPIWWKCLFGEYAHTANELVR